ncbi:hypothetical protein DVH24_000857 [Malus domestica]|uniref:Uncharacterized protein n=1 Tax=Malus domestica TaxID=3750 RepID=A0A498K4N6_MALDO|nr:hypothetical protein DVH24_000857 [Malus domestica]
MDTRVPRVRKVLLALQKSHSTLLRSAFFFPNIKSLERLLSP